MPVVLVGVKVARRRRPPSWPSPCCRCRRRPPTSAARRWRRATAGRGPSSDGTRRCDRARVVARGSAAPPRSGASCHAEEARQPQPEHRPGPPMEMAVATPAMLPTPTVDASAVATAWNGLTLPAPPPCLVSLPSTSVMAKPSRRTCTTPVRTVSSSPVPIRSRIIGQPQTYPFTRAFARWMASIMACPKECIADAAPNEEAARMKTAAGLAADPATAAPAGRYTSRTSTCKDEARSKRTPSVRIRGPQPR